LLIDKALHEPFESISDTLLNDTAITCRMPYAKKSKELESFTDCTALSSGWVWNTPLWSRMGTGYVFSSRFQSQEDAQKEFKNYLVKRFDKKRVDNAEFNVVQFKTGKYKRGWVGNCLALTLASGFIEPLESTGLAITGYQIEEFIKQIKTSNNSAFVRASYNKKLDEIFKDTHNFVLLHYVNTTRDDSPYWKYIQNNIKITDDFVDYSTNIRSDWFDIKSKDCILIGMNYPVKNLMWRDVELNQYTKSQHKEILKELSYLKNRKAYYIEKTEEMSLVTDYLEKNIYSTL
jgi:tryptophan halogenase